MQVRSVNRRIEDRRMFRRCRALIAVLIMTGGLVPAAAVNLFAQVTTGTLVGVITNPSGRPLARATVKADDELHAVARTAITDDAGYFRLSEMPPASYVVTASATGFRELRR